MTELYEFPPTRSQRAKWALEELGIAYSSQVVDLQAGQQNSDAYRAIHPLGVVPALKTGAYTMFESVAIVLQLIDEHPEANLAPAPGTPQRAAYYQWCVFAGAELDPALMMYFDNAMRPLEAMRPPGAAHRAAAGRGPGLRGPARGAAAAMERQDHPGRRPGDRRGAGGAAGPGAGGGRPQARPGAGTAGGTGPRRL